MCMLTNGRWLRKTVKTKDYFTKTGMLMLDHQLNGKPSRELCDFYHTQWGTFHTLLRMGL